MYSSNHQAMKQAIDKGTARDVAALLDGDYDIDSLFYDDTGKDKETALIRAAGKPHPDKLELLLARGADIKAQSPVNRTNALLNAVRHNLPDNVRLLLKAHAKAGISVDLTDINSDTPLIAASAKYYYQPPESGLAGFLGDLNIVRTLRDAMERSRQLDIVEMLLEAGADMKLTNDQNETALDYAAYHENRDIFETLLDRTSLRDSKSKIHLTGTDLARAAEKASANLSQHENVIPEKDGIFRSLANAYRDWLFHGGLDQHPELLKKFAAAANSDDYRELTGIIEKSFYVLHHLDLPPTPDHIRALIAPKENETIRQMAGRLRCYDYRSCRDMHEMRDYFSQTLFMPAGVLQSGRTPSEFVRAHIHSYIANPKNFAHVPEAPAFLNRPVLERKSAYLTAESQQNVRTEWGARTAMMQAFNRIASATLVQGRNVEDLLGLSQKWHSPHYSIPADLRPLAHIGRWHALTPPFTARSGYKVICRTDSGALQEESRIMSHCAGTSQTVVSGCLNGIKHIISVVDKDNHPVSTMLVELYDRPGLLENPASLRTTHNADLRIPRTSEYLYVMQHRGKHNDPPPPEAVQAATEWKHSITSGMLTVNVRDRGETKASRLEKARCPHTWIDDVAGFDITRDHLEKLFRQFRGVEGKEEEGVAWQKGLRGLKFSPKTAAFSDDNANYLIHDVFTRDGEQVRREQLALDQWLTATGAKTAIQQWLDTHIDASVFSYKPLTGRQASM